METLSTRRWQTTAALAQGLLSLPGSVSRSGGILSPYFQMTDLRKEAPGRDIQFISSLMSRTGFIQGYQNDGSGLDVLVTSWDDTSPYTAHGTDAIYFAINGANTQSAILALAVAAANAFAAANGFTYSTLFGSFDTSADVAAALANYSPTRTVNYPTLAVNTARQASTTSPTLVHASVDITCTLSLSGGTSGKVQLQYADNAAFTTNVVNLQEYTNANTGTLTAGLNTSQTGTTTLAGFIPAGKYYRLATTNVTGTPTYGTPVVQEVVGI